MLYKVRILLYYHDYAGRPTPKGVFSGMYELTDSLFSIFQNFIGSNSMKVNADCPDHCDG